jgi:hypothetical protein
MLAKGQIWSIVKAADLTLGAERITKGAENEILGIQNNPMGLRRKRKKREKKN